MKPIKNVLAPTDFSDSGDRALEFAASIAKSFGAKMTILHVIDFEDYMTLYGQTVMNFPEVEQKSIDESKKRISKSIERLSSEHGVEMTCRVEKGNPADTICEIAKELDSSLVVMPTHGRKGLSLFFMGSVAERVIRSCPSPVLTTRISE